MIALLRLRTGNAELLIAPEIGGGIAALRFGGIEALRPASAKNLADGDPLGLAEFPMAPFVNRVAGNSFSWHGQRITLAPAKAGSGEALHGIAWQQPWQVMETQPDAALLAVEIMPTQAWPFACRLTRRFTMSPRALRVDMMLSAGPDQAMPAALGFHPYFPAAGATIAAQTQSAWIASPEGIPTSVHAIPAVEQLCGGVSVGALDLDHCFTGWDGNARLYWPSHALTLRAAPNPGFLQIYTPKGADYFCIEPQSAMPDAFNRPAETSGAMRLAPGQSQSLRLEIAFEERAWL